VQPKIQHWVVQGLVDISDVNHTFFIRKLVCNFEICVCEIFGKWWIFLRRIFNSLSATVNHRFIVFFSEGFSLFLFPHNAKKGHVLRRQQKEILIIHQWNCWDHMWKICAASDRVSRYVKHGVNEWLIKSHLSYHRCWISMVTTLQWLRWSAVSVWRHKWFQCSHPGICFHVKIMPPHLTRAYLIWNIIRQGNILFRCGTAYQLFLRKCLHFREKANPFSPRHLPAG
jgi:hypothetical protein